MCPHEAGTIEWDASLGRLLCECHLAIFEVADGSLYRQSSMLDKIEGLTPIELKVDENEDVHAV